VARHDGFLRSSPNGREFIGHSAIFVVTSFSRRPFAWTTCSLRTIKRGHAIGLGEPQAAAR